MANTNIMTVLGPVNLQEVGITYTHEHLSMTFGAFRCEPPSHIPNAAEISQLPFDITRLGIMRQYPMSFSANLTLDKAAVKKDVVSFKAAGGDCFVENSVTGLERDIEFVRNVSKDTGLKVVAGTGFYVDATQKGGTRHLTSEEMAQFITKEFTEGIDGTDIKAGVIGEVGCSWPLTNFERHSLEASAAVQQSHGKPVIIHPGREAKALFETMRVFTESGGDPKLTIMSHLDRSLHTEEEILEFAKLGCICEYDLFGIEVSHYQLATAVDMPSDAERIRRIRLLLQNSYEDSIVISHDVHTNHRLTSFGGHGYTHILQNVVPMMLARGITQDQIDKMIIHTPKRWLAGK